MTAARTIDPPIAEFRQRLASDHLRLRIKLEDVCESIAPHVPESQVRERALCVVRPECRAFLSLVLTRAPIHALERAAGLLHDGAATASLIDSDHIQELVDAALPEATWTKLQPIDAEAAKAEDEWARWSSRWLHEYHANTKANHDEGRWSRFFAGIEAPGWIRTAVKVAEAVDDHLRAQAEKRAAAREARRPFTYDEIVRMKGGTPLGYNDVITALRGTYRHPEVSPTPAPARAPTPTRAPAPAPAANRKPQHVETACILERLTNLRGARMRPPADPRELPAFIRWCNDEYSALQAYARSLVYDGSILPDVGVGMPEMQEAMHRLVKLRGAPFQLDRLDHAVLRWFYHQWTVIQARAASLQWRSATLPLAAKEAPAKAQDAPPQPAAKEAPAKAQDAPPQPAAEDPVKAEDAASPRLAALEDEHRRLLTHVAFLNLKLETHIKKADEERAQLRADLQEIRGMIAQLLRDVSQLLRDAKKNTPSTDDQQIATVAEAVDSETAPTNTGDDHQVAETDPASADDDPQVATIAAMAADLAEAEAADADGSDEHPTATETAAETAADPHEAEAIRLMQEKIAAATRELARVQQRLDHQLEADRIELAALRWEAHQGRQILRGAGHV